MNTKTKVKGGSMPLHFQYQYRCEYCRKQFKPKFKEYFVCEECAVKYGFVKVKPITVQTNGA